MIIIWNYKLKTFQNIISLKSFSIFIDSKIKSLYTNTTLKQGGI